MQKATIPLLVVTLGVALAAAAEGDFYTGLAAYQRGDYAAAIEQWRPLATRGDVEAQYRLGRMYYRGEGSQDDVEAARWYRMAADRGHAKAQNNLGLMYQQGRGVETDPAEAVRWYRRASEQGLATAQYNLAKVYDQGIGVTRDGEQAALWYGRAGEQGHLKAQYRLAVMYDKGHGIPSDPARAARWYRKAAKQDHGPSQSALGTMYDEGRGVSRDPKKAAKWHGRASAQGIFDPRPPPAIEEGRTPVARGAPEPAAGIPTSDIEQPASGGGGPIPPPTASPADPAPSMALPAQPADPPSPGEYPALLEWRTRAEGGDAAAQYRLGQMYNTGQGAPRNLTEAGKWYLEAAERGHEMAAYKLAFLYLKGRISRHRDYVQAHKWFSLSAAREVGDARSWRDKIAKKMTVEELALSDQLVREWQARNRGEEP